MTVLAMMRTICHWVIWNTVTLRLPYMKIPRLQVHQGLMLWPFKAREHHAEEEEVGVEVVAVDKVVTRWEKKQWRRLPLSLSSVNISLHDMLIRPILVVDMSKI